MTLQRSQRRDIRLGVVINLAFFFLQSFFFLTPFLSLSVFFSLPSLQCNLQRNREKNQWKLLIIGQASWAFCQKSAQGFLDDFSLLCLKLTNGSFFFLLFPFFSQCLSVCVYWHCNTASQALMLLCRLAQNWLCFESEKLCSFEEKRTIADFRPLIRARLPSKRNKNGKRKEKGARENDDVSLWFQLFPQNRNVHYTDWV